MTHAVHAIHGRAVRLYIVFTLAFVVCILKLCNAVENGGVDMYAYTSFVSDDWTDRLPKRGAKEELSDDMQRKADWPGNKILVPSAKESYLTRPAAFGPDKVDDDGLWGTLVPIQMYLNTDKNDGCVNASEPSLRDNDGYVSKPVVGKRKTKEPPSDWIALIERGQCTFEQKVRAAQHMGAKAVIVGDSMQYDGVYDPMSLREWDEVIPRDTDTPLVMAPDGDANDIVIPSCFVIRSSYIDMLEYASKESGVRVGLYLDASLTDTGLEDIGLLIFILPSLFALGAAILQHIRGCIRRFRARASMYTVRSLPCYRWHPSGSWERIPASEIPQKDAKDLMVRAMQAIDAVVERFRRVIVTRHSEQETLLTDSERVAYDTMSLHPSGEASEAVRPRWYNQDDCPICLINFEEGYV